MRPKASSSERKCRCLELDCALQRLLIHLKLSRNERKKRCWKLARQPWEPPLRLEFRSNGRKYRCRKLTPHPWEPLILPRSSRSEGKCRCLELGLQPLSSWRPLPWPPLCPASSLLSLHCRLPHRIPPLLTVYLHRIPPLARLLQTADVPPETARLVRCHNPWPTEDVLFCPDDALPAFVTGIPALSSGPELWIAIHNHRSEPLQLHSGQNIGVLEVVTLADTPPTTSQASISSRPEPPRRPPLPERLSPLQQQQLNELFPEFNDVFSQGEDDLGSTPLLEHTIETHGPPLRQPYRRQNPAVRREEMAQVQQMLTSNVICPSNSPWASLVVMVQKKDSSLRFCVNFRQLNAATVKDAHPLPRIDDLLNALHGAKWFSTLDLKSGYWQVPITEQDKAKTAFRTSNGQLFEFNQVPLVFVTLPPPSPASWTSSLPASTGDVPVLSRRYYRLLLHLGGAPRSTSPSL